MGNIVNRHAERGVVTRKQIIMWLKRLGEVYEENRELLTQLDADIGDADHGINMERGFKKVAAKLPELETRDIALIASVGGASGPLYGSFFIKAAEGAAGREFLDMPSLAVILRNGVEGLKARGKAQPGDKTMVDALEPAARALEGKAGESGAPGELLRSAASAAERGMKATVPLVAKKGRASYLGERSAGHQDPGATSAYLMIEALACAVCRFENGIPD
jgi:dihydroxyacetone kinase-like protein